jgi:hypothetical protein
VVTGSNGTETFISRDGSMIRLILWRPAQLCGEATGFWTKYDNLYLMDEIYGDQVSDSLPLGEVSTITYANQHEKLEYTQGELQKYDPSHRGIYDEDMVRAMEQFSQTRRLTNNVGNVLAEQGSKFTDPSHIIPHDLWQEIPVVSFDFLGQVPPPAHGDATDPQTT